MRIDLALTRLRFVKTRSMARALVERGHLRVNGQRVIQASRSVEIGDVLTLPIGKTVSLVQLIDLPSRRGPPAEAQSCYQVLDPGGETAIAKKHGQNSGGQDFKGNLSP